VMAGFVMPTNPSGLKGLWRHYHGTTTAYIRNHDGVSPMGVGPHGRYAVVVP
jgi:hypothetical protein